MSDPLEIVYLNPVELKPDPGNPRRISKGNRDRLRGILKRHGLLQPLVVNRKSGELVSGHQRRQAAIELKLKEVPVVFVDLDDAEAHALGIALNSSGAQGEWEPELFAARLAELKDFDMLPAAALDPAELETYGLDDGPGEEVEVKFKATKGREGRVSALPDTPETQIGDVWELGEHRVICADSFAFDLRRFNQDRAVDLVITDPPYAIFGSSTGVASDVSDDRMVRPFFQATARAIALALDAHGHAYVHCDWRSWAALWEGFRAGGLAVRNMLVWDKGDSGTGSNFSNTHELVAFCHYVPKASNTFDNRRDSTYRPVYASNVLRYSRPAGKKRLHNAAKPVELLERLIGLSTTEGQTVADLFAGAGPVLIACENIGRRALVIDVDPGWSDVIVKRWRDLTGKKGRRVKGGALRYITATEDTHAPAPELDEASPAAADA